MMKISVLLCVLIVIAVSGKKGFGPTEQEWGSVTVRKNAHMFWWLHYTTASVKNYNERPLIIWLQGGPGASSTGFGYFLEIGPLDEYLQPRNVSWIRNANLLFVDNPVGTGFSFVDDFSALATTNKQIGTDFVELMKGFYADVPAMKKAPLYIFSESYGGKMAVDVALALDKAIKSKELDIQLKGVGLGDSWISPIDTLLTWAPFLKSVGMVDEKGYEVIMNVARQVEKALENGDYANATSGWRRAQNEIFAVAGEIDFYNILTKIRFRQKQVMSQNTSLSTKPDLDDIMNVMVKKALNLTGSWGFQSGPVSAVLDTDFMKPVTQGVEQLLNETDITVAVYNGQLDLIIDPLGTTKWLKNLHWANSKAFTDKKQEPFGINGFLDGYYKICDNLQYYLVLRAGHMVPLDNPDGMEFILRTVTNNYAPLKVNSSTS